ncbi:hypothetical protein [Pedobacter miscanthi]|uniref:Uncharacterized protein n=1 Tax=Pedobacter miscanthi TaxID=2259170 RepID=A0A366KMU9_9SPHI|nr:hypothetical protein [Pedobacter miscanthi]RBQ02996.1 hypothetical protein DRW42_23960 [Pedobacter miscanthi]
MKNNLDKFKKNNPNINLVSETEHINIENLWSDSTFMCRFKIDQDFTSLTNISLPRELAALYNRSEKYLEFIYQPLLLENPIINRKFTFYYRGVEFICEYSEPSAALTLLSEGFREVSSSSSTNYRNLVRMRDFYKVDTMPAFIKTYYTGRTPIVFKVSGDFESIEYDFVPFAKNLNFYMGYFDRKSPHILIFEEDDEEEKFNTPCYSNEGDFPAVLNARQIDPVLVDLFGVAHLTANTRLKFLFYFQVLEYCSYYHLTEEFRKKLTNIIKRPDLLMNSSYYGKLITEEFKDNFRLNDDSSKLEKLILEYINIEDIKTEIIENADYFKKDIIFDGGFVLSAIINDVKDLDTPPKNLLRLIKTNIEKIRNVLVHIRESRENKIILPTKKNTNLLLPYLHLLKRVAEKVAIQYE